MVMNLPFIVPIAVIAGFYILAEAVFAIWQRQRYKILNVPVPPIAARDYEGDVRLPLFRRMLLRMERGCQKSIPPTDVIKRVVMYVREHFFVDEDGVMEDDELPPRKVMDGALAWGFYGVHERDLTESQLLEIQAMHDFTKEKFGLVAPSEPKPGRPTLTPMRLNMEPLDNVYRSLAVYLVVAVVRGMAGMVLRWYGFRRFVPSTPGPSYWYRPAQNYQADRGTMSSLPTLFFHGIAPGGLAFYLPMIFSCFGSGNGALFLFEQPSISFYLTAHDYNESQFVETVWSAVDSHIGPSARVHLAGHSFGSCLCTQLVRSPRGKTGGQIEHMTLLDPVCILLSEPDVLTNFVYGRKRNDKLHNTVHSAGSTLVMNELFVEHFLRRCFVWYNGELWLESDLPEGCTVTVALSEDDEVLNAPKLSNELRILQADYASSLSKSKYSLHASSSMNDEANVITTLYWKGAGHGACLFDSVKWQQLRECIPSSSSSQRPKHE